MEKIRDVINTREGRRIYKNMSILLGFQRKSPQNDQQYLSVPAPTGSSLQPPLSGSRIDRLVVFPKGMEKSLADHDRHHARRPGPPARYATL